ncbi:hypothetical protein AHAS_Ahas20G0159300 [Arachis hypogaea]|uniref:Aminotransferase-like plant mobile domain-containing protein n=1 Tax=Arachis hypogaea TaxID=3818 RepID=A0A444X329_ARAHY|nr:hypothetical protein Ahy_B10g103025 [Arachis hypogaea]
MTNFGISPSGNDNVSSAIKLSWIRQIRDAETLDTPESFQHYVRCHIFYLTGTTLFPNKSTSMVSYKYFFPLTTFSEIMSYSWGSACLAYLYKSFVSGFAL